MASSHPPGIPSVWSQLPERPQARGCERDSRAWVGGLTLGRGAEKVKDGCVFPIVLPWINVSVDGDEKQLLLDVSEEQRFGLSLYLNKTQGSLKRLWSRNLVRPAPPSGCLVGDFAAYLGFSASSLYFLSLSPFLLFSQTGPQTIHLSHQELFPCLCVQVRTESSWGAVRTIRGVL